MTALPERCAHVPPRSFVLEFSSIGDGSEPPYHATSIEGAFSSMPDSQKTFYNISQRSLDIALSVFLLLILGPLLLLLALLVYIRFGSPVFYRQTRPGLHGKPFQIYKFRTMTNGRDRAGNLLPDEERITSFGQILRRCSLDELPEIINVLRGEMSIVGPRPLLMQYLGRYSPEQIRRHNTKPGITGWAQISGRNALEWEEKFRLDVWYVDNQSFWLDLKIIAITILKVLKCEGISYPGRATMEEFKGNS